MHACFLHIFFNIVVQTEARVRSGLAWGSGETPLARLNWGTGLNWGAGVLGVGRGRKKGKPGRREPAGQGAGYEGEQDFLTVSNKS